MLLLLLLANCDKRKEDADYVILRQKEENSELVSFVCGVCVWCTANFRLWFASFGCERKGSGFWLLTNVCTCHC